MATRTPEDHVRLRRWALVLIGAVALIVTVARVFQGAELEIWMLAAPLAWVSLLPDLVHARWERQRAEERARAEDPAPPRAPGSRVGGP